MLKKSLTFDDVAIIPRVKSTIEHRSEVDLSIKIGKVHLHAPIVSSPMDTVTGADMAIAMDTFGGVGIIHRFQRIEEQGEEFNIALSTGTLKNIGIALPVSGDCVERFEYLLKIYERVGQTIPYVPRLWVCLDTANGYSSYMENAINRLRQLDLLHSKIILMAGNVASSQGADFLKNLGVDIIRIGIGSGSACSTSIATGIGSGALSILQEIRESIPDNEDSPLLMLDGGIRSSGDAVKAFAYGANLVMLGRLLAGYDQSSGEVIEDKFGSPPMKKFRGLASAGASQLIAKINNTDNSYRPPEGIETLVYCTGDVSNFLLEFTYGIRSGMSYLNSHNFDEFKRYFDLRPDSIAELSYNSFIERKPKIN